MAHTTTLTQHTIRLAIRTAEANTRRRIAADKAAATRNSISPQHLPEWDRLTALVSGK